MLEWFLQLRIDQAWLLLLVIVLTAAGAAWLATVPFRSNRAVNGTKASTVRAEVPKLDRTRTRQRFWLGFVGFGIAATIIFWYLIDVANVFGIPVGIASRFAWSLSWAVVGGAFVSAIGPGKSAGRQLRRTVAIATIPLSFLSAALAINDDAGAIHELADLVPNGNVPQVIADPNIQHAELAIHEADWHAPEGMPTQGQLQTAHIPPTVSGFAAARDATVYLPPAALVPDPPVLPLMVLLSGQPGDTPNIFVNGEFQDTLEAFAAAHHGLAPIVVGVDQLGNPDTNPICADGALGNVRTYLEQDVVSWIEGTFNVPKDRHAWIFGGFSNGGTCAFQIGLDQPERYAIDIAIAPEIIPSSEDPAAAVNQVFGGDQGRFNAIAPLAVLQRHTPYADTTLFFGVGSEDTQYLANASTLIPAAQAAGITVNELVSPGTTHDFHTVKWVMEQALPAAMVIAGLITKDTSG